MSKFNVESILDLLFFTIEQERCMTGARSHFKEGSSKYEWYDGFVKQYQNAGIVIREYLSRKTDFEDVYSVWRKQ